MKSKKQMIDEIVDKSNKLNDRISKYELQIKSKAFVEYLYRWYILDGSDEQYDLTQAKKDN